VSRNMLSRMRCGYVPAALLSQCPSVSCSAIAKKVLLCVSCRLARHSGRRAASADSQSADDEGSDLDAEEDASVSADAATAPPVDSCARRKGRGGRRENGLAAEGPTHSSGSGDAGAPQQQNGFWDHHGGNAGQHGLDTPLKARRVRLAPVNLQPNQTLSVLLACMDAADHK